MRVQHFIVLGALALVFLLYTSYHQQHRLSRALHFDRLIRDDHRIMAHNKMNWHAVWSAAKVAGSEAEFIAAVQGSARGGADNIMRERMDASSSAAAAATSCPPSRECPVCSNAGPLARGMTAPSVDQPRGSQSSSSSSSLSTTATTAAAGREVALQQGGVNADVSSPSSGSIVQQRPSWTSFVVDGRAPQISKDLAQSVARNGAVIVTWANFALWDFVQTWLFHAKAVGLDNFLVGAMDAQIGDELVAAGVPCFAMYESGANHSGVGSDHLQWGGEAFHKMGRQKITLAQLFLGLGLDLLLVDVDVMLLGDVMEYFERYPQADILVTSDQLASTLQQGDTGLELPEVAQAPMNIGLMFFRYSDRTVKFVDSWLAAINADPQYWDQNAFNDLARLGWDPVNKVHPNQKRVFLGANGTLAVGVLPVASFSGGHTYYVQRLYEVQRVTPYAVHCTFQFGANPGKRNRLREAMLFHDPPSYYTDDLFVSVELRRVPSATWAEHSAKNNSAMKRYHFRGLDLQLEAVWPGLRVAAVTNRSLIIPELACYCDKYWTELDKCRVPGATQTRIPFLCPMDHVLDPIFMDDGASEFKVRWREHSFLDNPRCPGWVRSSRVTFYSSPTATKPVEKWVVQEGGLVVVLPANLTEGAIREVLQPYSAYKVWHIKDPGQFFGGFDNKKLQDAVESRINHLKPVMYPDPSPSPPPLADSTTAVVAAPSQTGGAGSTTTAAAAVTDGANTGASATTATSADAAAVSSSNSTLGGGAAGATATTTATGATGMQAGSIAALPER